MGKARSNGRAWWTAHVWNRAVAYAAAHPAARSGPQDHRPLRPSARRALPSQLTEAVRGLQAAFLASWGRYGRRRHTLRFVLDTVCERMVRSGSATVPCPSGTWSSIPGSPRGGCCGRRWRSWMPMGGMVLRRSFDPTQDAPGAAFRTTTLSLPESSPATPPLSGFPSPPSPFTPLPAGVRATLGPELWHAWCSLPADSPTGLDVLAAGMGCAPSQDSAGTKCAPCWAGCSGWRWWGWRCGRGTGPGCG